MIHIALCTDKYYVTACLACITSIFENNKDNNIFIHIITKNLSKKNQDLFNTISKTYNQKIEIITISTEHFSHLKISNRFREAIYYRFLIPDLIKAEKVLYLDSDTIITNSLRDLWETDLNNFSCGVIEDQASDDIRIHNRTEIDSPYFNSGVLLINTTYWKENNINQKLTEFIYKNPEKCIYPDQDALNIILNNKIKFLPYRYNFQEKLYQADFKDLFIHRSKWNCILEEKKVATIIHFTDNIKPWHIECNHPLKALFFHYISKCGIIDFKPSHYYNFKKRIIMQLKKYM